MTARKPERHPRRGSEKRARPHQVAVRLSDEQFALLAEAADRAGMTRPAYLREAFACHLSEGRPGK